MSAFDVEIIAFPWQAESLISSGRKVATIDLDFSAPSTPTGDYARQVLLDSSVTKLPYCISTSSVVVAPEEEDGSINSLDESATFSNGMELYNTGMFEDAARKFYATLFLNPKHTNAHFNMAALCHMFNYPTLAVGHVAALLLENSEDMVAHSVLWNLVNTADVGSGALTRLGIQVYTDNYAATRSSLCLHKLVTLKGLDESNVLLVSNNAKYAEHIYNDMNTAFEDKLVAHLGYRAPWVMHTEYLRMVTEGVVAGGPAVLLDLGCGSGLVGKIFHDCIKHGASGTGDEARCPAVDGGDLGALLLKLAVERQRGDVACDRSCLSCIVGVDISPAMVKLTAECQCGPIADPGSEGNASETVPAPTGSESNCSCGACYDAAFTLDAKETLRLAATAAKAHPVADVVVAADTFIYLGLLGEVFSLVREVFGAGPGLFFFTVENLEKALTGVDGDGEGAGAGAGSRSEAFPHEPPCISGGGKPLSASLQLLRSSARFAHSPAYILELCAMYSFRVLVDLEVVLRREGTLPVFGKIYMLSAR